MQCKCWKSGKQIEWYNIQNFSFITVDDKDPPWINEKIKCKIKSKNKTFQQFLRNERKITDFEIVDKEALGLLEMIQNWEKYFHSWLNIETE